MPEAFSFNREFDYIRLDGLSRTTGRPPHEWDLYILKELIDNALDADESLWRNNTKQYPSLYIRIEYIKVPPPQNQQLLIRVANQARFPVERIPSIFATNWYASRKTFIKDLTRGALGNALKTLLGIPYSLHNYIAGDWKIEMKALSLCCGGTEYLPHYMIDMTTQTINFECETRPCDVTEGTSISVGVDYFVQERARTLFEIETLAQLYHLCNPHARFEWMVEIDHQHWKEIYPAQPNWINKFRGIAPIQWYSLSDFKQLLGALYREQCDSSNRLPLKTVCSYFAGFNAKRTNITTTDVIDILWQQHLTKADIEGLVTEKLYQVLVSHSPRIAASCLGYIGEEHIRTVLFSVFAIEDHIQYQVVTHAENDDTKPFVIEVAAARLQKGKRYLWTAMNFAPTYNDPFLNSELHPVSQPENTIFGLRGLLDVYGFHEDTPCILFLHLACPNIEHTAFSKTEINHLPFEKELCVVLDQVLTILRHSQEQEEDILEQTVFQALDDILNETGEDERFVFEQLVEKLRIRLNQSSKLAAWLDTPEALNSLRKYIGNYQRSHPIVVQHIANRAEGVLCIPLHPNHYFSLPVGHASQEVLLQHHVNKILYVHPKEIESVVIGNNWLCRMDMALLSNPSDSGTLEEALLQCIARYNFPLVVLHDADKNIVSQMHTWLRQQQVSIERIVDLGLYKLGTETYRVGQPTRLVEMMPSELGEWLIQHLQMLNIAVKSLPSDADIRKEIVKEFTKQLEGHLLESLKQRFELVGLTINIDHQLFYTRMMKQNQLDEQIRRQLTQDPCVQSYTMVLEYLVDKFIGHFMGKHRSDIKRIEQEWLKQRT